MGAGGYGAALSAVGGVLQGIAASKAQDRMNQVFSDAMARQQHLGQQATEAWQTGLQGQGVETANQQLAQGQQQREQLYNQLGATPSSATGPAMSARDSAYGAASGRVRGRLGSYSDWELMQSLQRIKTQNELNKISNFSKGWEGVLPSQLTDAQHSQDELAFWGNLISSVGGGAGSFNNTAIPSAQQSSGGSLNPYSIQSPVGYEQGGGGVYNAGDDSTNPYSILQ